MKREILLSVLVAFIALLVVGCGAATPTPAPTSAPVVITVVITPTTLPPTATPAQPSLTPLPTVAITTTAATATPVVQATKPAVAKPAPTKKPTVVAAAPTATALPMKYGAPLLTSPIWLDPPKDERRFDADDLIFQWRPLGGLPGDECYLLSLTSEPTNPSAGGGNRSDYFVTHCGDAKGPADTDVKFTLYSPKRGGPNYSSIKSEANQMWVNWSITVVKNFGQCAADNPYHCKYQPISPAGRGRFLFSGS